MSTASFPVPPPTTCPPVLRTRSAPESQALPCSASISPLEDPSMRLGWGVQPTLSGLGGSHTGGGGVCVPEPLPLPRRWRTKQNLDYCFLMMYAQSKGIYYVQVSAETLLCPPPALDPGWACAVSPALPLCPS